MKSKKIALLALLAAAFTLFAVQASSAAQPLKKKPPKHHVKKKPHKKKAPVPSAAQKLAHIKHIVVIYEENHSFDNLYGLWGSGVNGLSNAPAARTTQVNQANVPFTCLMQNDVNLTSPPLSATCTDATTAKPFTSHFTNAPFKIDDYISSSDTTCPAPGVFAANGVLKGTGLPGGCTRDIVHRFYQEQYQLNGGAMNRYTVGSDAVGLTQGYYDTTKLPVYAYLHTPSHPKYVIADNFFQAAFGGSFLNHQWLVAAQTPVFANAPQSGADDLHSIVDTNGMPTSYPLYTATTAVKDSSLTVKCPSPISNPACGDYAINTTQPFYKPYAPGTPDSRRLPPLTSANIGDELSAKGVSWAWYSGGWSNANGDVGGPGWTNGSNGTSCTDPNANTGLGYPNCPDKNFQYHHQALNYWATYAPGTQARKDHLRDEAEFISTAQASAKTCGLRSVSFIKPLGEENEHPGYASESVGSDHLVKLLKAIEGSACAKDTMVIVTYDEFGGQWDHVPPPGMAGGPAGPHDQWGPGTRIPALILSPFLSSAVAVDRTSHDTTSILATIEHRFGVAALSSRDRSVADLRSVFTAKSTK